MIPMCIIQPLTNKTIPLFDKGILTHNYQSKILI